MLDHHHLSEWTRDTIRLADLITAAATSASSTPHAGPSAEQLEAAARAGRHLAEVATAAAMDRSIEDAVAGEIQQRSKSGGAGGSSRGLEAGDGVGIGLAGGGDDDGLGDDDDLEFGSIVPRHAPVEEESKVFRECRAALLLEDAIHGRDVGHRLQSFCDIRTYRFRHGAIWRTILRSAAALHMFLGFVERPYYRSDPRLAPPSPWDPVVTSGLEWACIAVYVADLSLILYMRGAAAMVRKTSVLFAVLICIMMILDVINATLAHDPATDPVLRFSRFSRSYFIVYSFRVTRHIFNEIFTALWTLAPVLGLIFMIVRAPSSPIVPQSSPIFPHLYHDEQGGRNIIMRGGGVLCIPW